jgi:hypothetical protein
MLRSVTMKDTKLKHYILGIRGMRIGDAAAEIGITRQHLTAICNGLPAGRRTAKAIEAWSRGMVSAEDVVFPKELPCQSKR